MSVSIDAGNETARRLIQLIADHAVRSPGKKLKKGELAKAAGITRQALHRFYSYLNPYISGEKPVSELLNRPEETRLFMTHGLNTIQALESEIADLKNGMEARIEEIKTHYVTSLMKSDLAIHDVDGLRSRLEAQNLHNDILVTKVKELEAALLAARSKMSHVATSGHHVGPTILPFDIGLERLFSKFHTSPDTAGLAEAKTQAIQEALARACEKFGSPTTTVVLFIERYLCSFDKFCAQCVNERSGQYAIIRTPLFSSLQLKTLILSRLEPATKVKVAIPYCESKVVAKAQRSFYFSSVPEQEFELADRMTLGLISDPRVIETVLYRIEQGD